MNAKLQVVKYFVLFVPRFIAAVFDGWLIILEGGALKCLRLSIWRQKWSGVFLRLVCRVLDHQVTYDLPTRAECKYVSSGPCIVVSNHANIMDSFVIPDVEARLGLQEVHWVMKRSLKYAPGFGAMFRHSGAVFLRREKGSDDIQNIEAAAALASVYNYSMGILPEGTRGAGFLLTPKSGGLKAIIRSVPGGVPIATISIVGGPLPGRGKKWWDAIAFFKRRTHVIVRVHAPITEDQVDAWLEAEWERKRAEIAAGP